MTEELMIKRLAVWLDKGKFPYQVPRCFMYGWECDFWCMTDGGITREFEIKISRSDFLIDKKKQKHADTTRGANYFYYVCPPNLISKTEVGRYGLIYISEDRLTVEKKPSKLHSFKFTNWQMLANKMYWKWYSVWWDKLKAKEITNDEWRAGFNIDIESEAIFG